MAKRVKIEVLNKAAVDVTVQNSNAINVEVPIAPRGLSAEFTANQTEIDEGAVVDFTATNPGFEYLFSIEDVGGFINKTGKTISHQFLDSGNFDVALTQADLNQQASGIQIKRDFIKVNEVEFILNTFSGATAAYSLRKLERSVTKAVRVREDSGNTEADISFSGGALDETALLNHCGSANGFVTKWYDQSGNGNDASNSTATEQPQIVSSGSVIKENGKPALDYDGSDDRLFTGSLGNLTVNSLSAFAVVNPTPNNRFARFWQIDEGANSLRYTPLNGTRKTRYISPNRDVTGPLNSEIDSHSLLTTIERAQNEFNEYVNSSNIITDSSTTNTQNLNSAELGVGCYSSNTKGDEIFTGKYQELIIYLKDQASNRTNIETNINNHYSIF